MTISARLLILVLLAVLPGLFIEISGEIGLRAERRAQIETDATRLMRLAAAEQGRIGEGARQLLIAFAEIAIAGELNGAACDAAARRMQIEIDGYVDIGAADAEGNITCSGRPRAPDAKADAGLFAAVMSRNAFAVGTYGSSRTPRRHTLTYGLPLRDRGGAAIGMLWATIDVDWLARHFSDRFPTGDTTLLVADREGTILVRLPNQPDWVGRHLGNAYADMMGATREGVTERLGIDGVRRIIAYSPIETMPRGLYVGVGIATGPVFARINSETRKEALLVVLGIALTLAAAWLGGNYFIRNPLDELIAVTQRWRLGDYSARVGLGDRRSEIGKLGLAFDAMAEALETRERQRRAAEDALAGLNRELERRVAAEVAEREETQAALVQSQKIEALGRLTSGVAHDFNNLLAAVLGNLELLRPHLDDPETVRLVDGALRAATRGAKLTEQLLTFSRHHPLEPRPFDGNAVIEGMGELLPRMAGTTVRIEREFAPDLWPALADPSQIELALLNLAINARDAMPEGGVLRIETANLGAGDARLPPELAGEFVMIAVADTGSGMSEEVAARAFEPFFTTKAVGKGTGLGLSMVYGVARQSGGTATIESAPGTGTIVRIFLPRAPAAPTAATAIGLAPGTPTGHGTILVVDDDDDVREVTAEALRNAGYTVHEAASGRRALELMAETPPPDLLILDYAMPEIDGSEVARRVRADHPHLPILMITGYAEASAIAGLPAGIGLLRKPFRIAELAARVGAALVDAGRPQMISK